MIAARIEAEELVHNGRLTLATSSLLAMIACATVTVRAGIAQTLPDTTKKVIDVGPVHVGPGLMPFARRSMLTATTGASAAVLDSAMLIAPGSRTLSELLMARLAGVSVLHSSGVLGAGSGVRLRGASSFIARREPLLVIDGTRVDGNQTSATLNFDGLAPSRLDDIDMDDVERVEVLRGPAAAAMYGADAAGGVIRVTTRTPNATPTLRFHVEGGATVDATEYPANFSTGTGLAGEATCARYQQAAGTCTPGPLLSWNPLERASPFQVGKRVHLGGSAVGPLTRFAVYAISGSVQDESGVLAPSQARRYAGRVNVDAKPHSRVDVSVRSAFSDAETDFPFAQSLLLAGLGGNAIDDAVNRGYSIRSVDGLTGLRELRTDQDIRRFIGSVSASWRPASWLNLTTLAGYESMRRNEAQKSPVVFQFEPPTGEVRFAGATERSDRTNLNGTATLNYPVIAGVTGETTIGIDWLNRSFRNAQWAGVTDGVFGSEASTLPTRVNGLSVSERLVWQRRRSIGVGVRRDRFTTIRFLPATNAMVDAAWGISEERFFPSIPGLNSLRLRGAYGRATDTRPLLGAALVFFTPPPFGAPQTFERDGERISEVELGFDARLFSRISLDATWYQQHSDDALSESGFGAGVLATAGAWRMTGIDAQLSAQLVNTLHTEWSARLTASMLSSRVERFWDGLRMARGTTLPGARALIAAGYPIAGVWGNRLRPRDANGDGIITPNEVEVSGDSAYLGSPVPTHEIGLSSSLTHRRVRLDALLDYRGGFRQFNLTEVYRCELEVCGPLYLPSASASGQARVVALPRSHGGFVEDGSFLRLREVSLTWTILPGWSWRHGFEKLAVTASGRNLLTSTGYSGLDPEVTSLRPSSLSSMEFGALPLPRTFLVRLDITR